MSLLRVWHIVNPPSEPIFHTVDTPKDGALLINKLALRDLRNKNIFANAFGLEEMQDGEWCEWYNSEGDDIETLCDRLWEEK